MRLTASLLLGMLCLAQAQAPAEAAPQSAAPQSNEQAELKYVLLLSRHGVRSPTGKVSQLNPFALSPWPQWDVPPGYLTPRGTRLMTLLGAYNRQLYSQPAGQAALFPTTGCTGSDTLVAYADSDQRTRESARAFAAGFFPECSVAVHALPQGTNDPLFHPQPPTSDADRQLALAAVRGTIGGNAEGLSAAYKPQLDAMQRVLLGCAAMLPCQPSGKPGLSLLQVPSVLATGSSDHLVEFQGPLATASTMAENFLLEYTDGKPLEQVGWGHVDLDTLRELLQLHTAASDVVNRTPWLATRQATPLLQVIASSLQQAVDQKPAPGALGQPATRMLLLLGHDTNLNNLAGALNLHWLQDGRRDDTPPGGAFVFELWKSTGRGYFVRTYYQAQTLDQMRTLAPLSLASPPDRVPVFVPGCGTADGSCNWTDFQKTLLAATTPQTAVPAK